MGTRHLQTVIDKNGVKRISQYGQWDGYPSGQGIDILNWLRTADLEKYAENVAKIPEITDEQNKMLDKMPDWNVKYPYMSRDCGATIHKLIEDGKVEFVYHHDEEKNMWGCEGFYTIDLQKGTFTAEYYNRKKIYKLSNLPTKEKFLKQMKD